MTATATTVFTTTSAQLLRALKATKIAAPHRPAVPCLAGLLIETTGGKTTLTQYSYDVLVRVDLDTTQATDNTRMLIHHNKLLTILNGLRSTTTAKKADNIPVSLIVDDRGNPSLSFDGYTMPLESMPVDDYPNLPTTPETVARFEAADYISALTRVAPSAGTDDTLAAITGVHLRITEDGAAVLEATDRYRAAQAPLTPTGLAVPGSYNLSAKKLTSLVKHVAHDGHLAVLADDDEYGMGGIQVDGITLITGRIQDFPSLDGFADPEIVGAITVDAKDLAKNIKVAHKLSATESKHPAIDLWAHSDGVEVAARVNTAAGVRATAPVCDGHVDGEPHAHRLAKASFLSDGVRAVGTDQVTIHYMPGQMIILTEPDTPTGEFRYLLMCIRTGE